MTDEEHFELVLRELAELVLDFGDQGRSAVLIGGQVLAIHSRLEGGSGAIEVTTETGIVVPRGFSMEPDLLLDVTESQFMLERIPEVLTQRGYRRTRDFRWSKPLGADTGLTMQLDLFAPPDMARDELPTPMTPLPDAELAFQRKIPVVLRMGDATLHINIPDPVAFIAMKLRAKLEQRPNETKDSFDLYAYVKHVGVGSVSEALTLAGALGARLRSQLLTLFWNLEADGVRDVLSHAQWLDGEERDLLAVDVVDVFAELGAS